MGQYNAHICAILALLATAAYADSPIATSGYELREVAIPPLQNPRFVPQGIIRVAGKAFVDDNCREFVPVGWNQYVWVCHGLAVFVGVLCSYIHLVYHVHIRITYYSNRWGSPLIQQAKAAAAGSASDAALVSSLFQGASSVGMTTMRIFGTGVTNSSILQSADGVYDESTFQAFDYILNEASKNNIKA